jgi:hypothetical protein
VGDLSEADIARKLFVSHSTVHSHVKSIYLKLGATSRAEAVDTARAAGFLPAYRSRNAAPGEPRADATTRRSESDIPLRMGQFRAKRSHESASSGPVTD